MADNTQKTGGIGFLGLLTILFIGLKLGNVIDWHWAWVLSPLWLPLTIIIGFLAVVAVVALLIDLSSRR